LGVLVLAPAGASAQDPLDRGLESYRTGEYEQAVRLLEDAVRTGPEGDRVHAARMLARAQAATGQYDAALEALDRAARSLPAAELATVRGLVLAEVGRHNDALAAFDQAIEAGADDVVSARLARAELLWSRGGRTEAYRVFDSFIGLYNRGAARTATELAAVGTAVRYLGRRTPALFHDAVQAYEEALRADPEAAEPRVRMADLFLAKYNGGEAQTLYREVLAVNPRHPEALMGMARAKRFEGSSESLELAEAAVEINPSSADGRTLLAMLRLELGDDEAAVEEATRALATNPRHREALAVRAAARFLAGEQNAYRADRDRALEIDPAYADFYVTVAELAVRRGRYREAVELVTEAVAVDSTAWHARALLGMNQLRLGRLEAARATLEAAYEGDPFNVWTFNTLDLMDRLAGFEIRRTARFELVLDPAEAELLLPYMEPVAEEAYDALAERYGFEPETPIRVEVYPDHGDFSVRTMGLTGLGALGVAFGNVLAMDSPAARDAGSFHWGSTLWHEIAHTFTLGMTRHRIPRWLTEGISVREERRSRPGWGEPVAFAFLQAFQQDMLLPMERIDAGFVRPSYPGQVGVSYQHASVVVELIENDHGPRAIRRMLDAYRDGGGTESVFRSVLGTGLDAFDGRFQVWVRERYGAGLAAAESLVDLAGGEESHPGAVALGSSDDPASLVRRARDEPGSFGAQLAAGNALFTADRADEAEPFLQRALELYPGYTGPGNPYMTLAAIRQAHGDRAGAVELLRGLTSMSESALAANTLLAELLMEAGDPVGAAEALGRAVFIHPYDAALHDRLADLAARLGRPTLEVRERKAIVALEPVDRAGALYRLAVAHRNAGDAAAARRTVLSALEIAPAYADAQDLLLDLAGGGR
jgi:tetratricopeptide (TPR) repeat protein